MATDNGIASAINSENLDDIQMGSTTGNENTEIHNTNDPEIIAFLEEANEIKENNDIDMNQVTKDDENYEQDSDVDLTTEYVVKFDGNSEELYQTPQIWEQNDEAIIIVIKGEELIFPRAVDCIRPALDSTMQIKKQLVTTKLVKGINCYSLLCYLRKIKLYNVFKYFIKLPTVILMLAYVVSDKMIAINKHDISMVTDEDKDRIKQVIESNSHDFLVIINELFDKKWQDCKNRFGNKTDCTIFYRYLRFIYDSFNP